MTFTTDNTGKDYFHYRQYRDRRLPLQIMQGYTTHTTDITEIDDFHYNRIFHPVQIMQGYTIHTTQNTEIDDFYYRQYRDR
jgi:hypothetical protein